MTDHPALLVRPVKSDADWQQARHIRHRVFVDEQLVRPEGEFDEFDMTSRHFVGVLEGRIVGTARWRAVHDENRATAKLERFAVLTEARGRGVGHALVRTVLEDARLAGFDRFLLHAQAHLQDFYGSHGFAAEGPIFLEEHLEHVRMIRQDT